MGRYRLNICMTTSPDLRLANRVLQVFHRGRGWSEDVEIVLAELLRED